MDPFAEKKKYYIDIKQANKENVMEKIHVLLGFQIIEDTLSKVSCNKF